MVCIFHQTECKKGNQLCLSRMTKRQTNPNTFAPVRVLRLPTRLTFSIGIKDGIPRDNQRDKNENAWQVEKPWWLFRGILRGRVKISLFPSGSRMGSQGTTKGTKMKMSGKWKNPSDFLLDFMRSYQDLTFSIRIQDGIPRDDHRGKKENVWQVEKP